MDTAAALADLVPRPWAGPGPVVTVDGRALDADALWGAVGAVAARVAGAAVVAVHAAPVLETVVAVLGGLAAGAAVVPVPADAGPGERSHILGDSGASLWLVPAGQVTATEAAAVGTAARPGLTTVPVDASDRAWPSLSHPDPGGAGLVMYTSGTTGPPKGVVHRRSSLAAGLDALAAIWAWGPDDVLAQGLPLFHVHGLILGVLGPLRTGGRLVHTGRPTPAAYAAAAEPGPLRASVVFGVPTVWSRLAADAGAAAALSGCRLLVSGSAGLPVPVAERLRALAGRAPLERYGMTETLITVGQGVGTEARTGWVGHPLPGVSTRLRGEDGGPCPHDGETIGELEVDVPWAARSYLRRPDADVAFGADGWFRTGDAAVIDAGGQHRLIGRTSTDLISSGGYRIGAGEVEAALLTHAGVREAAVAGLPDEDLGQVVVAWVVADGVTGAELVAWSARSLARHKQPRRVELVDALPRNAMGKVDKRSLLDG